MTRALSIFAATILAAAILCFGCDKPKPTGSPTAASQPATAPSATTRAVIPATTQAANPSISPTSAGREDPIALWRRVAALANGSTFSNERARMIACALLRDMGPESASGAPMVVECLGDESPAVRRAAIVALRAIGPRAAPALIEGLNDSRDSVRWGCVQLFMEFGESAKSAAPALTKQLQEWVPRTRAAAAQSLAAVAPRENTTLIALLPLLKDPDSTARFWAATSLLELELAEETKASLAAKAMPVAGGRRSLFRVLGWSAADREPAIAAVAAMALQRLAGVEMQKVAVQVFRQSDLAEARARLDDLRLNLDQIEEVAVAAWEVQSLVIAPMRKAEELAIRQSDAEAWTVETQATRNQRIVAAAAERAESDLIRRGAQRAANEATQRALIKSLDDPNPLVRSSALRTMTMFRDLAAEHRPRLAKLLRDDSAQVRQAAAAVLNEPWADRIAQQGDWVRELSASEHWWRVGAADQLTGLGLDRRDVMEVLVAAMESGDWMRYIGLADAARRAWKEDRGIMDLLRERAADATATEIDRACARAGLKQLEARKSDPSLIERERATVTSELALRFHKSTDPRRMIAALDLYIRAGGLAVDIIDDLEKAANSDDFSLRYEAIEALGEAGDMGVGVLVRLLDRDNPDLQCAALAQLRRMGPEAWLAGPAVLPLISNPRKEVQSQAIETLGALGELPPEMGEQVIARVLTLTEAPESLVKLAVASGTIGDPRLVRVIVGRRIHDGPPKPVQYTGPHDARGRRGWELFDALGSMDRITRQSAAREVADEHLVSPAVGAALTKAVDRGDFAARVGLIAAIEKAWQRGVTVETVLAEMSEDPTAPGPRAYARAATRAIGK